MPVYPLLLERATYLQHHQRILKIHRKIQEYTRNIEGNSFVELEGLCVSGQALKAATSDFPH